MQIIPPDRHVIAYCPECQQKIGLTHWNGADFDLKPVEIHIVQAHPELRDNRHVPNVRIQWVKRDTDS